jgi:hypothetical protein
MLHFASHLKVSEIRVHQTFDGILELISQLVFYWKGSKENHVCNTGYRTVNTSIATKAIPEVLLCVTI